jgi:nicotinamide mononucleotide transporter
MIEIIAVIFSLLSVYLTVRMKVINWPIGIVGITAYFVLFCQQLLYAQAALQIVFIAQSIYGWIYWNKHKEEAIKFISVKRLIYDIIISGVLTFVLAWYFTKYTDNPQPVFDALTTVLSLLATWYMSKKIIQNWLIWLIADVFFIFMFIEQKLYWSAALYLVFIFLVIKGLISWVKNTKTA